MNQRIADLVHDIGSLYASLPTDGDILLAGRRIPMSACTFHSVPYMPPGCVVGVDGGSATLVHTPAFSVSANRLACTVFTGRRKQKAPSRPTQYLSLMTSEGGSYRFKLYPYTDGVLPDSTLLCAGADDASKSTKAESRLLSTPRSMGELAYATSILEHMEPDAILLLDGSLHRWGRSERTMMESLMVRARQRSVAVCGMSKTSIIRLDGGRPLLPTISDRYAERPAPWSVQLGDTYDGICTFVVKLHDKSSWVYRLDVDGTCTDMPSILSSLASNSTDALIPGYPYALTAADRLARVRHDEAAVLSINLYHTMNGEARRDAEANNMHEYLNRVVG